MAPKRRHHKVTLKKKYKALKEPEKGRPNKDVANQFSISGNTLATWKKSKEKVLIKASNRLLRGWKER